ncbi:hypothetical protein H5410_062616 [Solanum commersonii]|uniref:Uncharacterized protein n=1 Tax=Solanum commersonii TaxID=4109 RepID=A0A9J5WBA4_SOLCO|nr:hypothetical protein H5410_062616 [Solanum commersonii]
MWRYTISHCCDSKHVKDSKVRSWFKKRHQILLILKEDVFPFKLKSKDSVPIFTYTGINHEVDDLKEGSIATHSQHNSQAELLPQEQVENVEVETSTNLQQTNVYEDIQAGYLKSSR